MQNISKTQFISHATCILKVLGSNLIEYASLFTEKLQALLEFTTAVSVTISQRKKLFLIPPEHNHLIIELRNEVVIQ